MLSNLHSRTHCYCSTETSNAQLATHTHAAVVPLRLNPQSLNYESAMSAYTAHTHMVNTLSYKGSWQVVHELPLTTNDSLVWIQTSWAMNTLQAFKQASISITPASFSYNTQWNFSTTVCYRTVPDTMYVITPNNTASRSCATLLPLSQSLCFTWRLPAGLSIGLSVKFDQRKFPLNM